MFGFFKKTKINPPAPQFDINCSAWELKTYLDAVTYIEDHFVFRDSEINLVNWVKHQNKQGLKNALNVWPHVHRYYGCILLSEILKRMIDERDTL